MQKDTGNLQIALDWLQKVIIVSLKDYLKKNENSEVESLMLYQQDIGLSEFISIYEPNYEEFIIILLALAPHIQPNFFNQLIAEYLPEGGDFPEFGGVKGMNHRGILPTGETSYEEPFTGSAISER